MLVAAIELWLEESSWDISVPLDSLTMSQPPRVLILYCSWTSFSLAWKILIDLAMPPLP